MFITTTRPKRQQIPLEGSVIIWFTLCNLCVLGASVVSEVLRKPSSHTASAGVSSESQLRTMLFGYAEQHQFTVRIQFIGNTYTRDRTLRIQMDELNEGNVFTIAALNRCLVRLSKVRNINNVTVKDVDIRLNHLYGILDLTITLTDTSRAPRRR
jgi:outer membrane protein assembly factor BamA